MLIDDLFLAFPSDVTKPEHEEEAIDQRCVTMPATTNYVLNEEWDLENVRYSYVQKRLKVGAMTKFNHYFHLLEPLFMTQRLL